MIAINYLITAVKVDKLLYSSSSGRWWLSGTALRSEDVVEGLNGASKQKKSNGRDMLLRTVDIKNGKYYLSTQSDRGPGRWRRSLQHQQSRS